MCLIKARMESERQVIAVIMELPFQNRVLLERLSHMEMQLRASEEDSDRLRREREQLRERLSELQSTLRDKEAEVSIAQAGPELQGRSRMCLKAVLAACFTCR